MWKPPRTRAWTTWASARSTPPPTKTDTHGEWGLAGLARIRAFSRHPLVAIGGLNAENAAEVVAAGADAIAVVSAVCAADDPWGAARELSRIIHAAIEARKGTP